MDNKTLENKLIESEKKRQELEERIDLLSDFVENAPFPLHWVNGSGIIIWANQMELDALGYTKEEYVGKHISTFHADKEVIDDILVRLIKRETLKDYAAKMICKDGTIKNVLINSNALWKDDKFVHTRCLTKEVIA